MVLCRPAAGQDAGYTGGQVNQALDGGVGVKGREVGRLAGVRALIQSGYVLSAVTLGSVTVNDVPPPRLPARTEILPLDVDGVRTVSVGTLIWALTFLALLPFADDLRRAGAEWWLWVCLTGVGLGLIGLTYCMIRRSGLRRAAAEAAQRVSGSTSS